MGIGQLKEYIKDLNSNIQKIQPTKVNQEKVYEQITQKCSGTKKIESLKKYINKDLIRKNN